MNYEFVHALSTGMVIPSLHRAVHSSPSCEAGGGLLGRGRRLGAAFRYSGLASPPPGAADGVAAAGAPPGAGASCHTVHASGEKWLAARWLSSEPT